jgi:hypothetical protein
MIEPHMILALWSLQKTCERPLGPKDEDAFYQQYAEPFPLRLYQGWLRLYSAFRDRRPLSHEVGAARSLVGEI